MAKPVLKKCASCGEGYVIHCQCQAGKQAWPAERDPNGTPPERPGAKLDAGKPQIVRGVLHYFPRALAQVARVSEFGAGKYSWNGWESVPDGAARYTEALGRHITAEATDGPTTPDSGLRHAAHAAWNALARLELMIRNEEQKNEIEPLTHPPASHYRGQDGQAAPSGHPIPRDHTSPPREEPHPGAGRRAGAQAHHHLQDFERREVTNVWPGFI